MTAASHNTSTKKANGVSKRREMMQVRMKMYSEKLFPINMTAALGLRRGYDCGGLSVPTADQVGDTCDVDRSGPL